jgi:hypothetical protein
MRQRNQLEAASFIANPKQPADDFIELFERKELRDGEFADRNYELGSKKIDFIIQPGRTIPDFIGRGDAVAAGCCLSRKTAANSCEINFGSHLFFVHSTELPEPAEKSAAGRPGKWFPEDGLFHARRLADQDHLTQNWPTCYRRRQHPRATPALPQKDNVPGEQLLFTRDTRHLSA